MSSLSTEIEAFLKNGGSITTVEPGKTLPVERFNSRNTNGEKAINKLNKKQRATTVEEKATLKEIKALSEWCKARKGRAKEVCVYLGFAPAFISQVMCHVRPLSKVNLERIRGAMAVIEAKENANV